MIRAKTRQGSSAKTRDPDLKMEGLNERRYPNPPKGALRRDARKLDTQILKGGGLMNRKLTSRTTAASRLTRGRHGVTGEGLHYGSTLDEGSDYHCMLTKIQEERFSGPSPDGFDHIKRDTPQKVLQDGPYSNAVTLERLQTQFGCC